MSDFLKPQSPLQRNSGEYIYPLTTEDQVIMDDGSRLSGINFLSFDGGVDIEGTSNPVNADTLGGRLASEFALKSDLNNLPNDNIVPEVTFEDDGKLLMVVDGKWAAVELPNAKEATF